MHATAARERTAPIGSSMRAASIDRPAAAAAVRLRLQAGPLPDLTDRKAA
jgi:hypothetical protein